MKMIEFIPGILRPRLRPTYDAMPVREWIGAVSTEHELKLNALFAHGAIDRGLQHGEKPSWAYIRRNADPVNVELCGDQMSNIGILLGEIQRNPDCLPGVVDALAALKVDSYTDQSGTAAFLGMQVHEFTVFSQEAQIQAVYAGKYLLSEVARRYREYICSLHGKKSKTYPRRINKHQITTGITYLCTWYINHKDKAETFRDEIERRLVHVRLGGMMNRLAAARELKITPFDLACEVGEGKLLPFQHISQANPKGAPRFYLADLLAYKYQRGI